MDKHGHHSATISSSQRSVRTKQHVPALGLANARSFPSTNAHVHLTPMLPQHLSGSDPNSHPWESPRAKGQAFLASMMFNYVQVLKKMQEMAFPLTCQVTGLLRL